MDLSLNRVTTYIRHRWNQRVQLDDEEGRRLCDLLAFLSPQKARDFLKTRIGAGRDGGYIMLNDWTGIELALSLGIGPDVSWDYAIAQRGIPVWQYDHTVNAPPQAHALFRFEPKRIVSQRSGPYDLPFNDLLRPIANRPFLLKIDIEGGEWEILAQTEPELLRHCRQIVVEFHDFISIKNTAWREFARQALHRLRQDFAVIHVHGNNLSKHLVIGNRSLPDSLEVTFVNRHLYQLEPTEEIFPGHCDKRNNPFFPDFSLGKFQFPSNATSDRAVG